MKEIQANIERKNKAREKYARWVESQRASSQGRKATTDYTAWDLWLPSDEEDEMIRDLTPSGPEFKAMEVSAAYAGTTRVPCWSATSCLYGQPNNGPCQPW